ncbi:protein bicaudal C homolog 1-A isoform X1 [Octopus sinensis]|uniref:Protein bicaudal C homolog 1-A isoform X1 n=2 Tax=Octopus sinensis TaxID=2607531 RepID=A0A6P7SF35_9MOLL|nr:protein bicaudal C homolog 1-A isoform X1 [Octopus sinensis]
MAETILQSLIPGLDTNSFDCSYLNSDSKSDIGDTSSQGTNDDRPDKDLGGLFEDRFRVDRRKLERMLQVSENLHNSPEKQLNGWTNCQRQGETCESAGEFFKRIMKETNTEVTWPSKLKIGAKSKKDPHIKVIGMQNDVKVAKDKIMSILDTKGNRVTLKMDVSHTDHSHVIGKGGNNIKKVMQGTGCHIHFPDSNRGNNVQEKSNQVSIAGQPSGVESARIQIRDLLPLVFIFEMSLSPSLADPASSHLVHLQKVYNVTISFKQKPRSYMTIITVRGSVYNAKMVKEATARLMEHLLNNVGGVSLTVSMQLEIAPQHHLFMIGRGDVNIKQIMQRTGASVYFPDPNNVNPLRKGTVYITGPIESVYQARQQLIGCLPLVLMFDIKEDIEIEPARISMLMEQLDVFISIKSKPKQPSKSVIVKSVERNAANMYDARIQLLGLDKETNNNSLPPPCSASTNGTINNPNTNMLGLSSLGYVMNGHSNLSTMLSPANSPSSNCQLNQWVAPPPSVYGHRMMVINTGSQASIPSPLDIFSSQCNGLHKGYSNQTNGSASQTIPTTSTNTDQGNQNPNENISPTPLQNHCDIPTDFQYSSKFNNMFNNDLTLGLLDLGKPSSPMAKLQTTISNGELASSLHSERSSESGNDSEGSDKWAPGSERKKCATSGNGFFPNNSSLQQTTDVDYEHRKLLATKAMQKKPVGESRVPTNTWSGMGFSKSLPESVIRNRLGQSTSNYSDYNLITPPYQQNMTDFPEVNRDPWKDSTKALNTQMPTPLWEYSSPKKRFEFGLSNSNHADSATLPTKVLAWSSETDLAELFSKLGLGKYTDIFQQQEIDLPTFRTMNDNDLRMLGISTFGARKKMLLAITELNHMKPQLTTTAITASTAINSNNSFQENEATAWMNNPRVDMGSLSGRW